MTTIDFRPATARFHTQIGWLDSWHSFSFSDHYDPSNTHHGVLLVSNDDRIAPAAGFPDHPHRDMEIVTWVLSGSLRHRDSAGHDGVIEPGLAQRMRAGRGIVHSEFNASASVPVHLVQMWVPPGHAGLEPGYEQRDVSGALDGGDLVPVVAGDGGAAGAAISIDTPGTTLWAARLGAGATVTLPAAPFVHLFVALGAGRLADRPFGAGDAGRFTDAGSQPFTAGAEGAEILVWEMHARIAPSGRLAEAL
jgi:redox-sensitive bicupin YhaK (pirin superfamily)